MLNYLGTCESYRLFVKKFNCNLQAKLSLTRVWLLICISKQSSTMLYKYTSRPDRRCPVHTSLIRKFQTFFNKL